VVELRECDLASSEIGTVPTFALGAMTVLAGRGVAVPERLSCSLITGWTRRLRRGKRRENRYQNEREQNSFHKPLTSWSVAFIYRTIPGP
jgi:hypothetical protein